MFDVVTWLVNRPFKSGKSLSNTHMHACIHVTCIGETWLP